MHTHNTHTTVHAHAHSLQTHCTRTHTHYKHIAHPEHTATSQNTVIYCPVNKQWDGCAPLEHPNLADAAWAGTNP